MLNPVSASQKAFTLAEVLITLAIIGVVAALTIPTVVRNYQERQTVTRVKKVYSQLNSAFHMASVENGPISTWAWNSESAPYACSEKIFNIIKPYLKILKYCASAKGCFSPKIPTNLNKTSKWRFGASMDDYKWYPKARLADGASIWVYDWQNSKDWGYGAIGVDIDGDSGPNVLGRDIFYFAITKNGLIPWGAQTDDSSRYDYLETFCNIKSSATNNYNGLSCASWIMKHDNMDYMHKNMKCTKTADDKYDCRLE